MDKESYLISSLNSHHIGDDGAVIGENVYSADIFCEDIHFKMGWMSFAQIGRKAMLVNLSDAIAMNAKPKYALVCVVLPKTILPTQIDELVTALEGCAAEYGCEIIGGDTVGGEKLSLSITIISQTTSPLPRRGLEVGDILAYTGVLGESKRDLERLFGGESIEADSRFITPTLRDSFVYKAREYLHCGMDISDGLFCDTNKLLDINTLGFTPIIDIPPHMGLSGEEYEMLIGFPSANLPQILHIAHLTNTPLTLFAHATTSKERYLCHSHHFEE